MIQGAVKIKCGSCRALARLRRRRHCWNSGCLTHRFRSLAKARQLPQGITCVDSIAVGRLIIGKHANLNAADDSGGSEDQLWELSSFSEAAKAAALLGEWLPAPPLSQPRQGSTAPTGNYRC